MFREIVRISALCFAFSLTACGGGSDSPALPGGSAAAEQSGAVLTLRSGDVQAMCRPTAGHHRCLGYSLTLAGLKHLQDAAQGLRRGYGGAGDLRRFGTDPTSDYLPQGYGPSDLTQAYKIPASANGGGRVVALVESGDAPTLDNDLSVYRAQYGLSACTIANGCLRKIAQDGSANLPSYDPNWAGETQLDVDIVSALCPTCDILVVEAENEGSALDIAENTAAQSGAFAISNSWGGTESSGEASYFNHPGIIITAASGDDGYEDGLKSPADFSTVIAVGGTNLQRADNTRGWSETVWQDTGSGCSVIIAKPAWQTDSACPMRTIADIAFDADPASGVAMYDGNVNDAGNPGWRVAGGTSVGAPAIAALLTLANTSVNNASSLYANASHFNAVVSGSNGTCSSAYLCNGETGYSAPAGNGTPNGLNGL